MTKLLFILLQHLVPQHFLSRCVGKLAECRVTPLKNGLINQFIKAYKVDMSQAQRQTADEFENFNDFFTRELKEGQRPICDDSQIASPADGAISEIGGIHYDQIVQAKHKYYTVSSLLASATDAQLFTGGQFATVYLSPKDYHRVHMPVAGKLLKTRYIPGDLYSVNQTTADNVDNVFARNERLVCLFETEQGPVAVVLVGAMIVAGISTVWQKDYPAKPFTVVEELFGEDGAVLQQGDELGRFYLGSTAIVLMPEGMGSWDENLSNGCSVVMGEAIGEKLKGTSQV